MKYTMNTRVRYSEVGMDDRLTLDAVLKYFQDCAVFQSEDLGCGIEELKKNHMVWFLSSWQICIGEYPVVADRINVSTWPYGFQRMMGERNHTISTPEGKILAWGNSNWVLMDTQKQRPIPVPGDLIDRYTLEEPFPMEYMSRKIAVPKEGKQEAPVEITRAYLDSNNHVNNAVMCRSQKNICRKGLPYNSFGQNINARLFWGIIFIPLLPEQRKSG